MEKLAFIALVKYIFETDLQKDKTSRAKDSFICKLSFLNRDHSFEMKSGIFLVQKRYRIKFSVIEIFNIISILHYV